MESKVGEVSNVNPSHSRRVPNSNAMCRILSVALMSIVGSTALWLISTMFEPRIRSYWQALGRIGPGTVYLASIGLSLCGLMALRKAFLLRPRQLLGAHRWPSCVYSAIGALIGARFLGSFQEIGPEVCKYSALDVSLAISEMIFLMVALDFRMSFSSGRLKSTSTNEALKPLSNQGLASFERWLLEENPIEQFSDDLIDRSTTAERISDSLVGPIPPRLTAILGEVGAGKSSVANLIRSRLLDALQQRQFIFAEIGCWGVETPKACVRKVLSGAIEEVSRQFDVVGLTTIPTEYLQAVSGDVGRLSSALLESRTEDSPEEILGRLNALLDACNRRLILTISDMERSGLNAEGRQMVNALLWRLRSNSKISILWLATPEDLSSVIKLSEQVEYLHAIRVEDIHKCLAKFLDLSDARAVGVRYPVGSKSQERAKQLRLSLEWGFVDGRRGEYNTLSAIAELASTPRMLKSILRHAHKIWLRLLGEIDLVDVLELTVLRYVVPNVFVKLISISDQLRLLPREPKKEQAEQSLEQWKAIVLAEMKQFDGNPSTHKAVWRLCTDVMPMLDGLGALNAEESQRVWNEEPTDYLRRFLREGIGANETSDQAMLEWIEVAGSRHPKLALLRPIARQLLTDTRVCDTIGKFAKSLTQKRLGLLSRVLIRWTLRTKVTDRSQMWWAGTLSDMLRRFAGETQHLGLLTRIAAQVIRRDIALWCHFELHWARGEHGFLSGEDIPRLREEVVRVARSIFEPNPERLIVALEGSEPGTLLALVSPRPSGRSIGGTEEDSIQKWSWLGRCLLVVAKLRPEVILPQVEALCDSRSFVRGMAESPNSKKVNKARLRVIFGVELPQLKAVVLESRELIGRIESLLDWATHE